MKKILIAIVLLALISCKTTYIPVESTRTDTVYISKQQRDSIMLHDSIYLHEWTVSDTVYLLQERWHTKYRERIVHDTLWQHRVDSIAVPYPVKEGLSAWETMRLRLSGMALGACIAAIALLLVFAKKIWLT